MYSSEDKRNYFELGIAFARFSAKPDEDEHKIVCKVASRVELKIPDYNELITERIVGGGVVGPPSEWFEGSDGESRRNYYRIGTLSFAIFLLAQGNKGIEERAVQELKALFRAENIPKECLEDYIADLQASDGDAAGAFRGFLATFSKALQSDQCDNESISERISNYNIFIVHGHDGEAKHKVARFIENLKLTATILDEQPSKGQTIIDKFEEHADEAAFAIVLLTADDVGAPKNNEDDLKSRARQNVILELGYFLHGLGRERVCVLHEEGVELPSDIQGIVYVPFDKAGGWKGTLSRELAALDIIPSTLFLF